LAIEKPDLSVAPCTNEQHHMQCISSFFNGQPPPYS